VTRVGLLHPGAMGAAVAADNARAAGEGGGPLAGIPVLVSDTIDVAGLPTTGGSLALKDVVPATDAALVTRLKAAGAIILGKANVTELNGMVAAGAPAGYGSLHGQVMNPYDMRSNLNSATGGAVAAAAAGLAAVALALLAAAPDHAGLWAQGAMGALLIAAGLAGRRA
jgi:amidase